ncbi:hypothetical protein [Nitratifractor sp.]|uniref:hypothetical protein n=1 Tax=Nitratifractor sp. TaxID=2268144 RepID=UPI0025F430AD|nr:hypothetical protein [Nitratifractor sp.]
MATDLSPDTIAALHRKARGQNNDLYTFLKRELPDLGVEERLQTLAAVLNDYLEEYRWENDDELKDEGYIVKRFYPLPESDDA